LSLVTARVTTIAAAFHAAFLGEKNFNERRIVSSSSSSSPKKEEKEGGGGKKFASLDDHTINTILGPYEARECSAWTDYQRISNSWVKKISQECDEKTKRKITERHIEALSILFCQVAAKEEKVLEDPERVIHNTCRLADVFDTNVANVLRAFSVSPFLCFTDARRWRNLFWR